MKEVFQRNSHALETGVQQNENDDPVSAVKAASSVQTKKGDSEIVR